MIKSFSFKKVLFITFVFSFFFFVNLGNAQTSTTTDTTSTTTSSMTATTTGSTMGNTATTTGSTTATSTGTTTGTTNTTGSVTVTPPVFNPQTTVTTMSNVPLCEIQRTLRTGSSGEDVRCLQRFLNFSGFRISEAGIGSMGSESTYFGVKTASAVARWQNANAAQLLVPAGLSMGTGNFGPLSFNYYVSLVRRSFGLSTQ